MLGELLVQKQSGEIERGRGGSRWDRQGSGRNRKSQYGKKKSTVNDYAMV